jgi:hypothetical protein
MAKKEKVFIVLSHVHSLKKDPKTGKGVENAWEVSEKVEFVSHLKPRHHTMSTAIGDYINRTMISGARSGMVDYDKFDEYVRTKYAKQMADLDTMYSADRVVVEQPEEKPVFVDQFGNAREKTVFDV